MTGINETKELLVFVARLGSALRGALEDGQIGFTDIEELFGPIMAAKSAFENVNLIPSELGDLEKSEADELTRIFATEFDLDGIEAEDLTEEGIALALSLVAYVNALRGTV